MCKLVSSALARTIGIVVSENRYALDKVRNAESELGRKATTTSSPCTETGFFRAERVFDALTDCQSEQIIDWRDDNRQPTWGTDRNLVRVDIGLAASIRL